MLIVNTIINFLLILIYLYIYTCVTKITYVLYDEQVDIADGFDALGLVLWFTLDNCQKNNDVHNAKLIMMLSQVSFHYMHTYTYIYLLMKLS